VKTEFRRSEKRDLEAQTWLSTKECNNCIESDLLALKEDYSKRPATEETINDPTNPKHYWRFRVHVSLELLLADYSVFRNMNKEPTKGIQKESANLPNGLSLESDSGHKGEKKEAHGPVSGTFGNGSVSEINVNDYTQQFAYFEDKEDDNGGAGSMKCSGFDYTPNGDCE
jgi:hypothetical protein